MDRLQLSSVALCVTLLAGSAALAQNSGGNAIGQAESAPAVAQDGLPALEKIMKDALDAVGGQEALDKVKTLHTVMSMQMMGTDVTMEQKWSRDGGRVASTSSPMGSMEMGTDGTTAWMNMPGAGHSIVGDEQAEQLDSQASLHIMMLDPRLVQEKMAGMEVVGREEFNGRAANVVRFEPEDSEGEGFLFFDAGTGRILGLRQTEQSPMGEQTTTMTFGEWKKVGGVEFFHELKVQSPMMPGGPMDMKITTLKVNELDESAFALPEEVAALVAADAAEENSSAVEDVVESNEIALEDLPESDRERATSMVSQIKAGGQQTITQSLQQFQELMPSLPEGDDKLTLRYIIQELRKGQ